MSASNSGSSSVFTATTCAHVTHAHTKAEDERGIKALLHSHVHITQLLCACFQTHIKRIRWYDSTISTLNVQFNAGDQRLLRTMYSVFIAAKRSRGAVIVGVAQHPIIIPVMMGWATMA